MYVLQFVETGCGNRVRTYGLGGWVNLIQVQKEGRWPVLLAFGQTDRAVAEEAAAVLQEEFEAMGFAAEVIGIQERDCNLVVVVEGGHLEGTMRLIETYIVLWYEEPQEEALVAG